jgi:ABC-type methionine transport system permease subunit
VFSTTVSSVFSTTVSSVFSTTVSSGLLTVFSTSTGFSVGFSTGVLLLLHPVRAKTPIANKATSHNVLNFIIENINKIKTYDYCIVKFIVIAIAKF